MNKQDREDLKVLQSSKYLSEADGIWTPSNNQYMVDPSLTHRNTNKMVIIRQQYQHIEPKEKSKSYKIFIAILMTIGILAAIALIAFVIYGMNFLLNKSSNPEILMLFWIVVFMCGALSGVLQN